MIFDTNVLLSLFVFANSRYAPLRLQVESGAWRACSSPACLAEFERVLARPMFGLTETQQGDALHAWIAIAEMVASESADRSRLPRCSDRDDQKFLNLALESGAGWLVTADKALLKLARRQKLRDLFRIVTPEVMLGLAASSDFLIPEELDLALYTSE